MSFQVLNMTALFIWYLEYNIIILDHVTGITTISCSEKIFFSGPTCQLEEILSLNMDRLILIHYRVQRSFSLPEKLGSKPPWSWLVTNSSKFISLQCSRRYYSNVCKANKWPQCHRRRVTKEYVRPHTSVVESMLT